MAENIIRTITEAEAHRLSVDAIVGDISIALEKLDFLTALLNDNYLSEDWEEECCNERIQREMFVINSMFSDYLDDIRMAKDTLEEEFDL